MVDDELLAQCRAGNDAAFRTLYHRALPRVRTWVGRLLGPSPSVPDVVQDVFLQVHRSIGAFRGESSFPTWLYRVTLNVATSSLRRSGRAESLLDDEDSPPEPSYDDERRLHARDELRRLYDALDKLTVPKRMTFILYEIEGLTLREIADHMDTGIPTVAARLRRARLAVVAAFGAARPGLRAEGGEG